MKQTFVLIIAIFVFNATSFAQDSVYVVDGNLEKIKAGTIYLNIYQKGQTIKDSTQIVDGEFTFTGTIKAPYFATLTMPERKDDFFSFYIEPATIVIKGRGDSLKLLTTKGSQLNSDDKLLTKRMAFIKKWEAGNSKLYEEAYQNKNKAIMDSLDEVDSEILKEKRKIVAAFVKDYPNSLRGAMAITENFSYYAEASDVLPIYNILSEAVKKSAKGREIKGMIDVYSQVAIGKQAPEITQYTPDSTLLSLSSLKGKFVLIDFWASWCGPCRRENPNIVAAYKQFKDKGFTVFGVSYDTKKDRWLKAIGADNLDWYHVSTLDGWKNETSNQYGIKAIPSNVLINREGVIVAKNIFGQELVEKLKEVMK